MAWSNNFYLSYTGFMKFHSCSEQYKLEYIDRERPKVEDARNNIHGNVLHNLLEEWIKRGKFEPEWLVRNAEEAWERQKAKEKLIQWRHKDDEQQVFEKTMNWAGVLAELVEKYNIDPATCEAEFKADTDVKLAGQTVRLGGRIDILKTNKAGQKVILDLKASTNRDIMKKEQLVWYSTLVGLSLKNHDEPVAAGYLLPGLNEVIMHKITQQDKIALMNRVQEAIQDILAKKFKPSPGKDKCFFCAVKHACPAVGRITPPRSGMIDLTELL